MKIKQIDKIVLEISKQEMVDELIKNFVESTKIENNDLGEILKTTKPFQETLQDIQDGNYLKIFQERRAMKCLTEEVFVQVEDYFFGQEEDEEEETDEKILSFKKGSKDLKDQELELVIVEEGQVVGRIPESEIPY